MIIFHQSSSLNQYIDQLKRARKQISFVPTMGALHGGHIRLIESAKLDVNTITICSIFVNPTQFNNPQDLAQYPISTEQDIALLEASNCDILFLPAVQEIYPDGTAIASNKYDLGKQSEILEGKFRPGHFQGVAQVVDRLLSIILPDYLVLGQKDYQQVMVIQSMIKQIGYDTRVLTVPTLREQDGLAMSSRNRRLTETQRALAPLLYQCLISIEAKKELQSFSVVQQECKDLLSHKNLQLEYVALADANTLELLEDYDLTKNMIALIAAYNGKVRLIDNLIIHQI